ncbi:RNA-binding S4 domain-containing protein [Undibacterium oligocarboniphilum]|uniref:RNA-binding S4 domain-containing protein n=1 Tax=Undibacterium oligocarboniphilum TaxID=666702 RepID=A0A850QHL9_9BURK|nr:RNA-binding S4 domain-containing protein [Undibacterium oligocarboniphilum]MBC3870570.1 RNA-binding S4 domain-containing protein [Undibacterium oligocarboniphilum]NVO78629.1 RNA-binding S4 domain-containing protein [Undibacterium oligocarboniphilum]
MSDTTRIDKWLWAARFFKTRSLATHAVELGRVQQNGQRVKPAHNVKAGDLIEVQQGEQQWQIRVLRILDMRGPAAVAQTMYQETPDSLAKRTQAAEDRKYFREPAAAMQGRPTKRDRRQIDLARG